MLFIVQFMLTVCLPSRQRLQTAVSCLRSTPYMWMFRTQAICHGCMPLTASWRLMAAHLLRCIADHVRADLHSQRRVCCISELLCYYGDNCADVSSQAGIMPQMP